MIDLRWVGVNSNSGRIWGYLYDSNDNSLFSLKVFWGTKNGQLLFKGTRQNPDFWKNVKLKKKTYNVWDTTLNDRIIEEYEQISIIRKLKNGY